VSCCWLSCGYGIIGEGIGRRNNVCIGVNSGNEIIAGKEGIMNTS